MKPYLIDIPRHSDDRGTLDVIEFTDSPSRSYIVRNWMLNTVRAFHGHPKEWRIVVCVSGAVKIATARIDGEGLTDPEFTVLSYKDQKGMFIPPGYANGWRSLTHDACMIYYAPTKYQDRDDVRFPWDYFGGRVWDTHYH